MAFPWTFHTTFIPNSTPVIPADYLNQSQEIFAALVAQTGLGVQKCWVHCYDGVNLTWETLHGAIVRDSVLGIYTAPVLPSTPSTVGVSGFSASTWYYVYETSISRVASFTVSTTPPGADLRWMGTDDTKRFLFSFKTTAAGLIDPFTHRDGVTEYMGGDISARPETPALIASSTLTVIPLTYCPPHARRVLLYIRIENHNSLGEILHLFPKGVQAVSVSPATAGRCIASTGLYQDFRIWMETDSTPAIEGFLGFANPADNALITVAGWNEFR